MKAQIHYRQQQDPNFVCPESLILWKDEIIEDSEKKMMGLWDIFIRAENRSNELEEKLKDEELVTVAMTVEATIHHNKIENLKKRIA